LYTSVPWIFAAFTDFFIGGWLVDKLIERGYDASRVRQTVLIIGTAFGLGILGAAQARTPGAAIFWISLSLGGLAAAAPVGWSIPSLIAPPGSVGTLGGILNFGNQLSAIVAPIATGYIASATYSFSGAFIAATAFLLIGIIGYIYLLGRIEPIPSAA
jgi:MFS family permease